MTKENFTAVGLIVDRSGSMNRLREDAEGGVNAFIDKQREIDGEIVLSLTDFDTVVEVKENLTPIANVERYTLLPRGNTALYDAIGETVTIMGEQLAAMDEDQRPSKVILVIVTDGQENSSHEWNREQVADLLKRQQERFAWEIMYLSASPEAFADGRDLNIRRDHTHSIPKGVHGMSSSYAGAAETVAVYATTGNYVPPVIPEDDTNA